MPGREHWTLWGVPNCGKGQPEQVMGTGHGASPSRFRNIKIGERVCVSELLTRRCEEFSAGRSTPRAPQGVTEVEAILAAATNALTRFANNTIHQNVAERRHHLSVRPVIDGRTARASTNRLDRDGDPRVVEEAIAITRLTEPDADLLPLAEAPRLDARSTG